MSLPQELVEEIETMVRDITDVGFMPKSKAKKLITDFLNRAYQAGLKEGQKQMISIRSQIEAMSSEHQKSAHKLRTRIIKKHCRLISSLDT